MSLSSCKIKSARNRARLVWVYQNGSRSAAELYSETVQGMHCSYHAGSDSLPKSPSTPMLASDQMDGLTPFDLLPCEPSTSFKSAWVVMEVDGVGTVRLDKVPAIECRLIG